jgi:hypothetical protein
MHDTISRMSQTSSIVTQSKRTADVLIEAAACVPPTDTAVVSTLMDAAVYIADQEKDIKKCAEHHTRHGNARMAYLLYRRLEKKEPTLDLRTLVAYAASAVASGHIDAADKLYRKVRSTMACTYWYMDSTAA